MLDGLDYNVLLIFLQSRTLTTCSDSSVMHTAKLLFRSVLLTTTSTLLNRFKIRFVESNHRLSYKNLKKKQALLKKQMQLQTFEQHFNQFYL